MNKHVCAGIEYTDQEHGWPVHSDLCGTMDDSEWRTMLHTALDEWLNKSHGKGWFFVGDVEEVGK